MTRKLGKRRPQQTRKVSRGKVNLKDITMTILSWDAYKTIDNTLRSFKRSGILSLVNPLLFFQEISERDKEIAKKYNIPFTGDTKNIGITDAFIRLLQEAKTPYILFAEQDFEINHGKQETARRLQDAITLLDEYGVDVVKLRDKKNPGRPLHSRRFSEDKLTRVILETFHFLKDADKKYRKFLEVIPLEYKWYKTTDKYNLWSNNNFLAKTDWLRRKVLPVLERSKQDPSMTQDFMMEKTLIKELKGYTLAAGPGLFTHKRLDRGE